MFGCLKSCVGKLLVLALLLAATVWAVVRWEDGLPGPVAEWLGTGEEVEEPSPELAEATLDRFESFRAGAGSDRLSLGRAQLSSVVRYALPGILPPGVNDPEIALIDGKVQLSARVATAAFPELPSLEEVIGFLPDTVDIRMRGSLLPFDDDNAALHVDRIHAVKVPLPDRFKPDILEALGREDRPGLPPDAILIPLPTGLKSVYVLRDSLVLVSDR